jgi:hypothetical protein
MRSSLWRTIGAAAATQSTSAISLSDRCQVVTWQE